MTSLTVVAGTSGPAGEMEMGCSSRLGLMCGSQGFIIGRIADNKAGFDH